MTVVESIISGIVQGLTEFLPISSSGHLVLLHKFFGFEKSDIFFDVCLHVGTLFAVIVYFWKDIIDLFKDKNIKWFYLLIIAMIPICVVAVLFESNIEAFFSDIKKVGMMLIVTSIMLFIANFQLQRNKDTVKEPNIFSSIIIGIGQAFAILPGISRSGSTISSGLFMGMNRETAFRFSFLLSIPAISAAMLYKLIKLDLNDVSEYGLSVYAVGMISSFIVGLMCLPVLRRVIKTNKLYIFAIYCFFAGSIVFFIK